MALESEIFLLGIWKDYQELEDNLSMPELSAILVAKNKSDYEERRFLAALQGVDLEKPATEKRQTSFDDIKARVFSGGQAKNSDDILSLQGINASQAGFGIGAGLEYSDLKGDDPKNPFG